MYVVIYLYGYADTIALSNAKAAGKNDIVLNMMLLDRLFKKLDDIL